MPRCNTCNDLNSEVLQASTSPPHHRWSFYISKKAEEFKRAAASGCVPCSVVLQAIALYEPSLQAELVQTVTTREGLIKLFGNGNGSLNLGFPGLMWGQMFELFEEWDHSENHTPLFSAVGLRNTPPDVLDFTYAGWRAKRWISRCDDEHECGGGDAPFLPARVLAITSDPIKLIVPTSGTTGRFAALSYCWGSTGNLTTTSNNIKEREAGIQWETLPNLFQDVVQITRQMGIHFLWIDALCIIQDDQADWQRESSNMGGIYSGAYVTIACDSARDTSYRLTNPRNCVLLPVDGDGIDERTERDDSLKALAPVVIDGHAHSFFVRNTPSHVDILSETPEHTLSFPLMMRGWTMQERLLSNRILHFTAHEMVWECQNTYYCECGGIPQGFRWGRGITAEASFWRAKAVRSSDRTTSFRNLTCPGDTLRNESFVIFWTHLIDSYTTRRLTFESDRLPAISAIAKDLGLAKTYLAGLWLEDLPWHLAWVANSRSGSMRPSVYNGPTWSWVSVSTKVWWSVGLPLYKSHVRVIEASTAPVGLDEFGQVAWGRVRLQASVAAAKVHRRAHCGSRPLIVTPYGDCEFTLDAMCANILSFEEGEGQIPSDQKSLRTVADNEDIWCFPVLGTGKLGVDASEFAFWIMVVVKPELQSIQRALLDPNDQPESMICERIGCIDTSYWADSSGMREWLCSSEFTEKEVIII